jgi:Zn-dependent protease
MLFLLAHAGGPHLHFTDVLGFAALVGIAALLLVLAVLPAAREDGR